MPERIQLRRRRGYRMPPNTISVARPSRFGNRFKVGKVCRHPITDEPVLVRDNAHAVELHRIETERWLATFPDFLRGLIGKNLGCYCDLDEPCHADTLLDLANRPVAS